MLLIIGNSVDGQNLMEIINRSEKAVFSTEAYNKLNDISDVASGFFISSDGMAITRASIFYNRDSLDVKTRNGKIYQIERIISVNPYTDLALIKIKQKRQKAFSYFQLSRNTLIATRDMLILGYPKGADEGVAVEPIAQVGNFPFVNRYGFINTSFDNRSFGAPVVNSSGLLTGIYCSAGNEGRIIVYSARILNDTTWVNINKTQLSNNDDTVLMPYLGNGVAELINGNNVEAARSFSKYLKLNPGSYSAYCLRAIARYRYNNTVGAREDLESAKKLSPTGFFVPYIKAVHMQETDNKEEALRYYILALERNPGYTPAKVEHARLIWKLKNRIREAYREFNAIIVADSLNGDAYYERARLSMQYSSNREKAYEDINKAIYLDPSLPGAFTLRGVIKLSSKDFLSAINDFTKAISRDPGDVHAYFNRGIAYFNIGMKKNACDDWQKAGELGNFSAFRYISRYCSKSN